MDKVLVGRTETTRRSLRYLTDDALNYLKTDAHEIRIKWFGDKHGFSVFDPDPNCYTFVSAKNPIEAFIEHFNSKAAKANEE